MSSVHDVEGESVHGPDQAKRLEDWHRVQMEFLARIEVKINQLTFDVAYLRGLLERHSPED